MLENRDQISSEQSLFKLYDRGAHFVLCRGDKKPCWARWQKCRPNLETALHHTANGYLLGLVPFSILSTGLDIDQGNPRSLWKRYPPRVSIASRRQGGFHSYYADTQGHGNQTFELEGCKGEIRGARGYLILYDDAAEQLARADFDLAEDQPGWFPEDLWQAAGVPLPTQDQRVWTPTDQSASYWAEKAAEALRGLAKVYPGKRNNALFDATRFYAYAQHNRGDLSQWADHINRYALNANNRFPVPLETPEVEQTAWSVSSWVFNGGGAHRPFTCSTSPPRSKKRQGATGSNR